MEGQATFHMGVSTKLTKEQLKKRKLERLRKKVKKAYVPLPKRVQWRIVPCSVEELLVIDTLQGDTFLTKMESLEMYGKVWFETKNDLFPLYKPDETFLASLLDVKKRCKKLMIENQHLRWRFKHFVTAWRSTRFHNVNDTDFITLNPIVCPIRIPSFSLRACTLFEASSLLNHIHRQLLHHDGPIPEPLVPRNPYTNAPFTLAQLISIRTQCKQKGESRWTLEAFAKTHYKSENFLRYNRKSLRMHAIKSILYNYQDYNGMYLLLNFIESQHEEHNAIFQKRLYCWCLVTIPEEAKIQSWRNLCQEYYELEILAEDDQGRDDAFFAIREKTEGLCSPPYDLHAKRKLFLRMKKDGSSGICI